MMNRLAEKLNLSGHKKEENKMTLPKAYSPETGYQFQILCRMQGDREYEHCDYATDRSDKVHLLSNYRAAYGAGWSFKTIILPQKYWPQKQA
jgi:hypothetical protein